MIAWMITAPIGVLLTALALFGFLPGAITKMAARVFPRSDPRRKEMIAEVYAVPRWERPFWVAEQLERVFTEALPARLVRRPMPWQSLPIDAYGLHTVVWYRLTPYRRSLQYRDVVDHRNFWLKALGWLRPAQHFDAVRLPGGVAMMAYPQLGGKEVIAYLWKESPPVVSSAKPVRASAGPKITARDVRNGLRRFRGADGSLQLGAPPRPSADR